VSSTTQQAEPALVVASGEFGTRVSSALKDTCRRHRGDVSELCKLVTGDGFPHFVPEQELTDLLNARKRFHRQRGVRPKPRILFVASAVELSRVDSDFRRCLCDVRYEMNRSKIRGSIGIVVYIGPVQGQHPAADTLRALDADWPVDFVIGLSDTDGNRSRLTVDDAVIVGARVTYEFLSNTNFFDAIEHHYQRSGLRQFTVGYTRMSLSKNEAHSETRRVLRRTIHQHLFDSKSELPAVRQHAPPLALSAETSLYSADGNLRIVQEELEPALARIGAETRSTMLKQGAQKTYEALAYPAPVRTPKPFPWWKKLWKWFNGIIRGRLRSFTKPQTLKVVPSLPRQCRQSADPDDLKGMLRRLLSGERVRSRLSALELMLLPTAAGSSTADLPPYECRLWDVSDVVERLCPGLPDGKALARRLIRELPLPQLLDQDLALEDLRQRVDDFVNRAAIPEAPRMLSLKQCQDAACSIGSGIPPLLPLDTYQAVSRIVCVPSRWKDALRIPRFQTAVGRDDDILLLVVASGFQFIEFEAKEPCREQQQRSDEHSAA